MKKDQNEKSLSSLDDEMIIALYWARNERAIVETDKKYKHYLYTIAYNILHDSLDCEECLNDTYLGTWNTIPPARPTVFQAFISKIMRNISIGRYKKKTADKRIPSEMTVSLGELGDCLPSAPSAEEEYFIGEVGKIVSAYLRSLPERSAFIFICRYYCSDKVADIAAMLHVAESTVFRELTALREGLREILVKEGYYNA